MKSICIEPRRLQGNIIPPGSKSMAHRLIIAAALSGGRSMIENISRSKDIDATINCVQALGAECHWRDEQTLSVKGRDPKKERFPILPILDCEESGSTLRFMLPIALAAEGGGIFLGHGRLLQRPLTPYYDLCRERNIQWIQEENRLVIRGELEPGKYVMPGNVSSQFFSGMLFALPLLDSHSELAALSKIESAPYLRLTIDALKTAGVTIQQSEDDVFIIPASVYRPFSASVEPDWSQAAFWYAAQFLGSNITPVMSNLNSVQGDRVILDVYRQMRDTPAATALTVSLTDIPDLLPPLAIMAALRPGLTEFTDGSRLRLKESDRLVTTTALLRSLGAWVEETPDGMKIQGLSSLDGGVVNGANDHRIVMAAAIAATRCQKSVIIHGAEAVNKSYPRFWEDYQKLGGEFHVL